MHRTNAKKYALIYLENLYISCNFPLHGNAPILTQFCA